MSSRRLRWLTGLLIVSIVATAGCTRRYYRRDADRETYRILAAKSSAPQWAVPPFSIEPPPQSRNFDPYNPDRPPQPPDDPAAHAYMHDLDGMHGYHGWHKHGDAASIEAPTWLQYLELSDEGVLNLNPDRAVELGLLNSRDYQFELERLYLPALALTLARIELLAPGQAGDSSKTQDALDALNSLLSAKNALIAIWVAYETDRLQLLLDMEALELDERGIFNDAVLGNSNEPEVVDNPAVASPPLPIRFGDD